MDNINSNSLLGQQYSLPESRDEFVNTNTGEIIKQDKIDPMDVIRKMAEKIGKLDKESKARAGFREAWLSWRLIRRYIKRKLEVK